MALTLPESICFRVTRYCNARCVFCLAPPDGSHPDVATLIERLDWLLAQGVRTVHFCGGEPTIHPGIAQLIEHVHNMGGKTRLTTNGIAIRDDLVAVVDWVALFCVKIGVRRLSILPFIPRGNGYQSRHEYELTRVQWLVAVG